MPVRFHVGSKPKNRSEASRRAEGLRAASTQIPSVLGRWRGGNPMMWLCRR